MSYSQYGLDVTKKSQDAGEKENHFYDPWTWQHVTGRNFYLCFSNWVISRPTIAAFQKQQPIEPLPGDDCFKCRAKGCLLHYQIEGGPESLTGICQACVDWAATYLNKEPITPPGHQFSLFQ